MFFDWCISYALIFAVIKFKYLGSLVLSIMNPASPTRLYGLVVLIFLIEGKIDWESWGSVLMIYVSLIVFV